MMQVRLFNVCKHSKYARVAPWQIRCMSGKIETKEEFQKPSWIKFNRASHGTFFQQKPRLSNVFLSDAPLQNYLKNYVPKEVQEVLHKDLTPFGCRIVEEIDELGWQCEVNLPYLQTQDAWGENLLELVTCSAWKQQHDISAKEGIVSIAYEKKLDYWSRFHQICKLYLYAPSSGLYSCPLAMTDGAAKTISNTENKVEGKTKELLKKAYKNLTTRDPSQFWTSGQWMTERKGGSDVSGSTETVAVCDQDRYRLYGYKWFSSATDSDMALTLARIAHDETSKDDKLTMFYLDTRNADGHLNNMQIVRLKDKLGTRQLPTAELLLDGTIAHKVSEKGRGIAAISDMLNITRLHNSTSAVSGMRRMLMLSRNYSHIRSAFGRTLAETPLHMRILSQMELEARGSLLLLLKVAILLGKTDVNAITPDESLLLRILLPILKLYTAKQAVSLVSEGIETFGGQGYMEDTRLPRALRDSQILPIWEGTTNVMSMDVIRSLFKTNFEVLLSLNKNITLCLEKAASNSKLNESCAAVKKSVKDTGEFLQHFPSLLDVAARDLAYTIARTYIGALLLENAAVSKTEIDVFIAKEWCEMKELCLLKKQNYTTYKENDSKAVMEGYCD